MPAAWEELFARRQEIRNRSRDDVLDVALERVGDRYRQVVGAEVDGAEEVPEGMTARRIPAGRYVHHRHEGPLTEIAAAFARIDAWASENGVRLGDVKLDVGYTPGGDEAAHDLFAAIED